MIYFSAVFRSFLCTIVASCLLFGCNTKKNEAYYKEHSITVQKSLSALLRSIHGMKDARQAEKRLRHVFDELAILMIAADAESKNRLFFPIISEGEESIALQKELERVLAIPGVEEVLRQSQELGYKKLKSYLQSLE